MTDICEEKERPTKRARIETKSQENKADIVKFDNIKGLTLHKEFITRGEHDMLLTNIMKMPWSKELSRLVQQYGYEYLYTSKSKRPPATTPIPKWMDFLLDRLVESGYFHKRPDQMIVNMYKPKQGIADHIDHQLHFGPEVASLTLQSHCVMRMRRLAKPQQDILLEPMSLLALMGDARSKWSHGIDKLETDTLDDGRVLKRGVRISITFRTMRFSLSLKEKS